MSIGTCSLDAAALEAQIARYIELSAYARRVDRRPGELTFHFDHDPPRGLLERTLEVERACCPFFTLDHDPGHARLRISVEDERHREALERLAAALTSKPASGVTSSAPAGDGTAHPSGD